jgi:DNA-binding NtrC family response regulator
MTSLRDQLLSGTIVPDYTRNRFTAFVAPTPAPTPKPTQVKFPPAPPPIAIDVLLADTLERNLPPIKNISLLEHTTRAALLFALRRTRGNQTHAAAMLGINHITLRKRCARHSVDPQMFGSCHGQPEAK